MNNNFIFIDQYGIYLNMSLVDNVLIQDDLVILNYPNGLTREFSGKDAERIRRYLEGLMDD